MKARLFILLLLLPSVNCLFAGMSGGDSDSEGEMMMALGYLQLTAPPPPGPLVAGDDGSIQSSNLNGPLILQWEPASGGQSGIQRSGWARVDHTDW